MADKLLMKKGYYSIYERISNSGTTYVADSGKTLYIKRFKKTIINPYRDVKEFKTLKLAIDYVGRKLLKKSKEKQEKLKTIPKSLYLIILKEQKTSRSIVKVGITSKRFILRRFSKDYGYSGYTLETIIRRLDTPDAEVLEQRIKDTLNKKRSIKKYRPLLENFSGYSECYDYSCVDEIIEIFDKLTKNSI